MPIIQADRAPISAHIPITDDLRPHFEKSAESGFHSLRVVESEETGLEVVIRLPWMTLEQAHDAAWGAFTQVLTAANVELPPPTEIRISTIAGLLDGVRRDKVLLERARQLADDGEHDLAVVVAQTACELLVAAALRGLAWPHTSEVVRPWLERRIPKHTLTDNETQRLWHALTGSEVQKQSRWWADYKAHVGRRNDIVHQGQRVDDAGARASLAAAQQFCSYVATTVASVKPPDWPPRHPRDEWGEP